MNWLAGQLQIVLEVSTPLISVALAPATCRCMSCIIDHTSPLVNPSLRSGCMK